MSRSARRVEHIALIVLVALLAFAAVRALDSGKSGSFATRNVPAHHSSTSKYPGCSFDGNYANDKPGACPAK